MPALLFCYAWQQAHPQSPRWIAYAITAVRAGFLAALAFGAAGRRRSRRMCPGDARQLIIPLADRRFPSVGFGCWFSFFNGLTQSVYPARVLAGIVGDARPANRMRLGQLAASPWPGRPLGQQAGDAVCPLVASGLLLRVALPAAPVVDRRSLGPMDRLRRHQRAQPNLLLKRLGPT